ncbi:MAG: porin [Rubrivivax sp.]|nr:MAG: porin [Rubrivivax sp.]
MIKLLQARRLAAMLCAAGLATWAAPSMAEWQTNFSGYGTVGAAKSNNDAQFTRTPIQYRGANRDWNLGVDTRLGLQGVAQYDKFKVVGQLLTQRVGNEDVKPRVEWLFGNYAVTDWLDLRAGRMVLPLFVLSDTRNVGFSSTWLRAPQEVYSLYPVTGVDGIQAVARFNIGNSVLTVQPSYGRTKGAYALSTLDTTIKLKMDKLASIMVNWEIGSWTLHLGKSRTDLSTHLGTAPGTITIPFPPFSVPFDATLEPHDAKTKEEMDNVGVTFDNGTAILQAEYAKRHQNPGGYENEGYYLMGGWRFGKLTPYYVLGRYKPNSVVAGAIVGKSHAAGVRYDLSESVAIKAQFERRDPVNLFFNRLPASPIPGFTNPPPLGWETETKKINIVSVAVDFVF